MRYTITRNIARTFTILIVLMIAVGVISVIEMNNAQNSTMKLVQEAEKGVKLFEFQSDAAVLWMIAKDYIITGDEKYNNIYKVVDKKTKRELEELKHLFTKPDEKKKLAEIEEKMNNIKTSILRLIIKVKENSKDSVEVLIDKVSLELGREMVADINELIEKMQLKTQEANLRAHEERRNAFILITMMITIAVMISVVFTIFTLKHISKPILKLVAIAQRIAARDFKVDIKAEGKDEIGMLVIAFKAMADEIGKRYEELENFSYIAAHDLKSPLTSVMGSAQFLLEELEGKLNKDEEILLRNIIASGQNMSTLITDLLEFAKAGKIEFTQAAVSMSLMLEKIKNELDFTIKDRNVKLTIQEKLPSFICDPVRFQEVWSNLISNAIKYNDKPEPSIEIGTIENEKHSHEYCFYVKDNGIGIDEHFLDKIFNAFQRATMDKKYEGTGIGLAIVKRIIEFHNGKIWAESTKDVGTTFYFTIPKHLILDK